MSAKTALKAAKSAIDAKKWDEAVEHAKTVLEKDPSNYFAKLFLGRANDGLSRFDDAANAYYDATKIKPEDAQAWLGLRGMYEGLGPSKVEENIEVGLKLAEIYMNLDDAHRSQSAIDKLVDHARRHGTKTQYAHALATQLPSSRVYSYLEGRLPDPSKTYTRIAEIYETQEAQTIKKLIDERKTRLGATLESTTNSVKNEIYAKSPLEGIYEDIINWTNDDELRRQYEEKLLERAYDTLLVLPPGDKAEKRDKVMNLAHDMVVIKHPYLLAWKIELEWRSGLEVEAY
ncbi:Superkiller protein 3 [Neocucurbitaria cava]|uniref:Superkiller protein 3 n=1 Tax=Neocucurbitaria cava TaxID=798079 RepID=A0A9W8Y232_9PLEO|nr:Superkiller protein 3 [Neocucurbitaria cava]